MLYSFIQNARTRIKGYKTIIVNSMLALPSSLYFLYAQFQSSGVDLTPLIPAKYVAATVAIVSVIGLVLRLYTTGAVGSKEGLPDSGGIDPTDLKGPI